MSDSSRNPFKRTPGEAGDKGAAHRRPGEPASFAWTEPLRDSEAAGAKRAKGNSPQVVRVGRGPSFSERLALVAPHPTTIAVGAALLLVAVTGLALISPSGDQATAARSDSPYGTPAGQTAAASADVTPLTDGATTGHTSQDPFAHGRYADDMKAQAAARAAKLKREQLARQKAQAAARKAAKAAPPFVGDFTYYTDYTPTERIAGAPGRWLALDGVKTLLVQSVTASGATVYVVSDVEVVNGKGQNFSYNHPLRLLTLKPGAKLRLADYRNVQGQNVTYTLQFSGSDKNLARK